MSEHDYEYPALEEDPHWLSREEIQMRRLTEEDAPGYSEDLMGFWYFWDETGGAACGPYETRAEAESACIKYAEGL